MKKLWLLILALCLMVPTVGQGDSKVFGLAIVGTSVDVIQSSDADAVFFSFTPYDTATNGKFNMRISDAVFEGSARHDKLFSWGYNQNGDNTQELAGEPVLSVNIENFYAPSVGNEYTEYYVSYTNPGGTASWRPFQVLIDRGTDSTLSTIRTDYFYLTKRTDNDQYLYATPGGIYLKTPGAYSGFALPATTELGGLTWYYNSASGVFQRVLDISAIGSQTGAVGGGVIRFITNPVTADAGVERMMIDNAGRIMQRGKTGPSGTTGGYYRQFTEAVSAALSGGSGTITVNVPSGARILGIQLRVDTLITGAGGAASWSAAYDNTPTTAICSGQAFTKNTKYSAVHPAYEMTTDTTNITITPNAGTFTAGVIRAIVYFEAIEAMGDAS